MTRLDYEKARRQSCASDYCGDDLPRTGSRADMIRYRSESESRTFATCTRRNSRHSSPINVQHDIDGSIATLRPYVEHMESRDFARKTPAQRTEIADIVRRILARSCILKSRGENQRYSDLITRAKNIVAQQTH